jgi:transcriptional regulator with XRE-family HTH domain
MVLHMAPKQTPETASASGERLLWIRKQDGRKQQEVAALVPITSGYLSRLERGDRKPPPWIAKRLAEIYGCPRSLIDGPATPVNDAAVGKGTEVAA